MHTSYRQQGLTLISLILLLAMIGSVVMVILKVAPLYMDNHNVANAFKAERQSPEILSKSKADIRASLGKRFNLNYVTHVNVEDINIVTIPGYVKVSLEYERVVHIIGNLSVLVEFNEGFEAGVK
jgi:Domain of unknown function (DUF4845)